ncbi:MAG: hypothetical protein H6912_04625 [Kordiimonadaceae bacterium]|nr:hypothetical protein [Kordiimonadaceae bacterium]
MSDSDQKQSLSTTVSSTASADTISQKPKNKKLKQIGILMSLLPLAACGGSSGGGGENPDDTPDPAPPAPTPTPDFTENPTNVFIAVDSSDSVLSKASATADLTVTGKGGNDTISTGSGDDIVDGGSGDDIISTGAGDDIVKGGPDNDTISTGTGADLIRGGNGIDAINAGADNDAIVVVGTTSANQYVQADITNPAGSGTDLSALITLADLNGRGVSEVGSGETIDGGTGTNTLFIYGTVDLTGVTLTNVTVLVVNSDVTLTAAQMAQFTTVDGDGSSVINIEVPPGDNYIIDLSSLNITDIGNLNIDGDVTFIIDDATDLAEIGAINTGSTADVKVQINGNGSSTNVNLGDIAAKINNATTIDLAPTVTLQVDDADDIADLGLSEIVGGGDVDTGGDSTVEYALTDSIYVEPKLVALDAFANELDETYSLILSLTNPSDRPITVEYNSSDGSQGVITFNPGETTKTISLYWIDNSIAEESSQIAVTFSNSSNVYIPKTSANLLIIDDDYTPDKPFNFVSHTAIPDDMPIQSPTDVNQVFTIAEGEVFFGNTSVIDTKGTGLSDYQVFNHGILYTSALVEDHLLHTVNINYLESVYNTGEIININGGAALDLGGAEFYNSGLISAQANQEAARAVGNWSLEGPFVNDGIIQAASTNNAAYGVRAQYMSGPFVNNGDIMVQGGESSIGSVTIAIHLQYSIHSILGYDTLENPGFVNNGNIIAVSNDENVRSIAINYGVDDDPRVFYNAGLISADIAFNANQVLSPQQNTAETILNYGQIYGDFELDLGNDIIHNYGQLTGDIYFGGGDDTFVDHFGLFSGEIYGEDGKDTIRGSAGGELIDGGAGDDLLEGFLGEDTLIGGDGNDTFTVNQYDLSFVEDSFDGGDGYDQIDITGGSAIIAYEIDLAALVATDIESLMLGTDYRESLVLTSQNVIDVTDNNNLLVIKGDGGDSVTSENQGWAQGADQDIDGEIYNTYTANGSTLLIDQDIVQDIS